MMDKVLTRPDERSLFELPEKSGAIQMDLLDAE